jgi:competence protein ComEC
VLRRIIDYRLRRSVLVTAGCLAIFAGIFLARSFELPYDPRWVWLFAVLPVLSWRRHNVLTLLGVVSLCLLVGWWRGDVYMQKIAIHESFHYQKVTVIGKATDEAVYGKRYQLEFTLTNVQITSPEHTSLVGNLTVRGFGEAAIYRGDIIQVTGKLFPTLGNNLGTISFADLTTLQRGTSWIDEFRRNFAAGMQSALPEPVASFALGLLIGQRTTLPEHVDDQLRHVGLTHIIAVSGYNLTVIVIACRRLLSARSKFQATATCVLLIGLFLLITGSSPPIVRASIISVLGIAAWYYGRQIQPLVLLLTGAAITVVANPIYLWGNVSWYLSFLAFYGVLVLAPLITKRIMGNKEPRMLTGILIESACANVMVLPYILYIFGETSLVSLPANLLVVPLIPLAMVLGLAAGLGGLLVPMLAGWFAWPAQMLLTYMLDIANLLSRIPHAYIEGISFPWVAMAAAYGTIKVVMLILLHKTRHIRAAQK